MEGEFFTYGVVLDKEPVGEQDMRVHLFTHAAGRITAKVKSARKPLSKLNGHLEPLSYAALRIIERGGGAQFQIVDALKERAVPRVALSALHLVKVMAPVAEPDLSLWALVRSGALDETAVLRVLGFDPAHASCARCGHRGRLRFVVRDLEYSCAVCRVEARAGVGYTKGYA